MCSFEDEANDSARQVRRVCGGCGRVFWISFLEARNVDEASPMNRCTVCVNRMIQAAREHPLAARDDDEDGDDDRGNPGLGILY